MDCRTRCTYCNVAVPILASQCVADGRAGLLHVDCAKILRAAGWESGQPMPPPELVEKPGPKSEQERHHEKFSPARALPCCFGEDGKHRPGCRNA